MSGVYPVGAEVRGSADVSEDGRYRYRLLRRWDGDALLGRRATSLPMLQPFVMLNPSTADARQDDPTIRRCVGFARREGFEGLGVWNLYAYRATKPAELWRVDDPVGEENDRRLRNLLEWAAGVGVPVVAAWGTNAKPERVRAVLDMPGAHNLRCLGTTAAGAPRHPLYVPADTPLTPYPEVSR